MQVPKECETPELVKCPFMDEPCPQGNAQGLECQLRLVQDFDPVAHFHDFEVMHCALCQHELSVAELRRQRQLHDDV